MQRVARPDGGRLAGKYGLVLGALVSAALVTSGVVHGYFAYMERQDSLAQVQRSEARAAAARITGFVEEVEREIGSVAFSPRAAGDAAVDARRLDYLRLLRLEPAIAELAFLDTAGRERLRASLASPTIVGSNEDYSTAEYFVTTRPGATYRSPVYFRRGSEPFITIAMREAGPEAGVVVAEVNLKLIWSVVAQLTIGAGGYAYVTDAHGQLIAHPDLGLVLRQTDVSRLPPVQAALRSGEPSAQSQTVAADLGGRTVLSVHEVVQPTGWLVVVNQPIEEALSPLSAVVWRTALLVLFGVAVALGASILLARRLVAPIRVLQLSAARIGAGDLEQRIEVHTGDELEVLAEEFNRMSARLRALYGELESKVDERTRELGETVHALEDKSRQLEIASQHKNEFLSNMSHELRTPLNAIIGFAEVLIDRPAAGQEERETRYLTNILIAGHHLLALINEILDLAKVEAGRMDLDIHPFSLAQVVENSLVWLQERAARHQIIVTQDVDPYLNLVEGDERKINQVLVNLLSNAVKFTPDGGRIEIRAQRIDDHAQVSVRDTGVGIAPADRARIFAPFEQANGSSPGGTEGTGLGLAISQRYVELHGGRIWVESALGAGSTFTFAVPLTQPTARMVTRQSPTERREPLLNPRDDWQDVRPPSVVPKPAGTLTVLAIDNHPMAIEVLEAVLAPEGYHVIPALGGTAGIELARREQPNLIVLDLLMPDPDGIAVLERLRADAATARIPILVLTSKTLSAEERALLDGKVCSIGRKGDFDRATFVALVHQHVRVAGR